MNEQTKWWSGVEERFKKKYVVKSNAGTNLLRYTDADKVLSFFHKEIQNRLHEEAVDSELPK